jgi:hypothetical protein
LKNSGEASFWASVVAGVLLAQVALAASPIPPFPKDGTVAVQDVSDDFEPLRKFLKAHRSPVGAKYHVAVVEFSDPHNRQGADYGDESGAYIQSLVEAWRAKVDTENAVIILLALRNRDIIVHPFSRWARMGWEQKAVVDTIDSSPFPSFARAGDYSGAIQALVTAIDTELAKRIRVAEQRTQQTQEYLSRLRTSNQEFEDIVRAAGYDPPRAREVHQTAMATAESAAAALEAGETDKAYALARQASNETALAERLITDLRDQDAATRQQRQLIQQQLDTLKRGVAGAEFDVGEVRSRMQTIALELEAIDSLLEKRTPDEALKRVGMAQLSIGLAEKELTHARRVHTFYTRTLPGAVAGALGLALLAWLVSLRKRSARRAAEAQQLLQHWETLLARVADNLLKFEDEHALILGRADLVERFDGATAQPVRAAAHEVDSVFLAYDAAQRVLASAKQELVEGARLLWLREAPYERAIAKLSTDPVVVRTEDVKERKLFLPDRREVRMTPQELLVEMQAAWERALRLVEQLETDFREAWEEMDRLKAEVGSLEVLEDRLVELGSPSPLQLETSKLAAQLSVLHERARRDPLGASEEAERLAIPLSRFLARTERLAQAVAQVKQEVLPRRDEASATVARLRGEGLAVEEPGFEPEVMLVYINRKSVEAMRAVQAGSDEEAVAAAGEAAASAAELLELCERTHRSRKESAGLITEGEGRIRALRARLPERRERIAGLRKEHADSALQPALDNAEEASGVLDQAAEHLTGARACVTPEAQRYLAGAELIDRAFQLLDSVDALYQEIETKADDLAMARVEAQKTLGEVSQAFADLQTLMKEDAFASSSTLSAYQHLGAELTEARAQMEAARPDWLERRAQIRGLAAVAQTTLQAARSEKEAWEKAGKLQQELLTRRRAYGDVLAKSSDDRQATNALFQTVSQEFDAALALTQQPRPSWPQILSALQRAAEGFEAVNEQAEKDFSEARQARKALAAADEAIRSADTHYGHGVTAKLEDVRASQARVSQLLAAHNYAEATRLAEETRKKAREAGSVASARALQLAEEQARRQREAARRSYSSSSSSSRSSFSSSSSRSSFSSSSSRSSFGSSSGRSSFSSSAGRSKW